MKRQRRLGVLILPLLLLVAPLLMWSWSTTSADFGASVDLGPGRLATATLDIELEPTTARFQARNLAPGDAVVGELVVVNAGTLPTELQLSAQSSGGPLVDWLLFGFRAGGTRCDESITRSTGSVELAIPPEPTTVFAFGDDRLRLDPGARLVVCLDAVLSLDAPNEVQGAELTVDLTVDARHDLAAERQPEPRTGPANNPQVGTDPDLGGDS